MSVLHEVKAFHSAANISIGKSVRTLTHLLIILNRHEQFQNEESTLFTVSEANDTFFAITKLFQKKNAFLRSLVYLCIKELLILSPSIDAIIVTSSLIRDMTGEDKFRAPAMRTLWRIADASMIGSVERYMKQAIVHKSSKISSSALVCALWMSEKSSALFEAVRRIVHLRQHQEKSHSLVQYHALAILWKVRQSDKLALTKLVLNNRSRVNKNKFADLISLRLAAYLISGYSSSGATNDETRADLMRFIESCLKYKGNMVAFEAAKTILYMSDASSDAINEAINTLRSFLESKRPVSRFAALRILNRIASTYPHIVGPICNLDLEPLISSQNRLIATYAITILLKTESESNIEALMKQLSGFMSDINDEFRSNVVDAVKALCNKFPNKQSTFMKFLSSLIREEGGLEFKSAVVDCITSIIEQNPSSLEFGLSSLCDFIEDCEHVQLSTRILHLIGQLGGKGSNGRAIRKYIRYIYNRIMLECPRIRAAAITALTKLALNGMDETMIKPVVSLTEWSSNDLDDDVRDRANFSIEILSSQEISEAREMFNEISNLPPDAKTHLPNDKSIDEIEFSDLFDTTKVNQRHIDRASPIVLGSGNFADSLLLESPNVSGTESFPKAMIDVLKNDILFKSCSPVELTESELEYTVRCVKRIYQRSIVFEFHIANTLDDVFMKNVRIKHDEIFAKLSETKTTAQVAFTSSCDVIEPHNVGIIYTVISFPGDVPMSEYLLRLGCTVVFQVGDSQVAAVEDFDDQLIIDSVETVMADLMKPCASKVSIEDNQDPGAMLDDESGFSREHDAAFMESEIFAFYNVSIDQLISTLVDQTFDLALIGTQTIQNRMRYSALMTGESVHNHYLAVAIRLASDPDSKSIHMKITVRSDSDDAVKFILSAVNS
ncbi:hypothetical protein ACOME3_009496 [Neoechinorhynchus agilis]